MRQLLTMAEARDRQAWNRLSVLLALTANCHRDPKKQRALRPEDFNPYARRRAGVRITSDTVEALKALVPENGKVRG